VTFVPTTRGKHIRILTVAEKAPGTPHTVQVSAQALAPVVSLDASSLVCQDTIVGQSGTCGTGPLTLTNTGDAPLTISSIVPGTDFRVTPSGSGCGTTIAPNGGTCVLQVSFVPTTRGSHSAALTIADNAPGTPHSVQLTGNAFAPVATFSAQTLTCPDTAVGATGTCGSGSPPSLTPLTLTNTGDAPLTISSIVASDDFKVTAGQCPATLAVGSAACTVQVTFAPTSAGNHVGGLTVTDNASGSPHSVQLTATGLGPAVSLSPSPLVCGGTLIGTTVACPLVTVVNTGNAALTISNIVMDGNFTVSAPVSGGCGASLAANQTHDSSCTLQVTFGPTVAGSRVGSMTITDNAPGSPHAVALSGTGQAPVVSLSPASVACPSTGTAVGTTATCGTGLTLTNTGDAPLTISSIAANDDFKVTVPTSGGCGTTLAPTSSCALQVSFTPTTSGNHTGSITVVDNAAGSPHAVQLTGTATAPAVSFDVQSVSCPDTAIGGSNPCPVVTLTNSGNAPLHLTSITANSPFSGISNTCGTADLGAGANCKITVTFAPGAAGNLTGFLSVADNAPGSPHMLPLSGNGVGTPVATVTAAGTCPDTNVGATANCTTLVTVANAASATGNLVMSLITISSEFGINPTGSTCGTILTPGNNCVLAITFTPAADGQRNGAVTITDNAAGSPQSVNLTGKGLGTVAIAISPLTVTCPDTLVGTTASCPTRVTITNSGTAQLTLSQIALTGDYALDTLTNSTCGTAVAPGASCSLAISFKPTATGARPGTVAITDNAPASPQSVTLTGNGIQPGLTVSPASITCPATVVGITAVCSTTLTNPGTAPLTLAPSITAGGSDYQLHSGGTNACTASLAANNATCIMYVDFKPTATGARTGTLSLGDNAPGSPHTIALSGTGTQPTATLSTTAITCADTTTTTTGMCQQVVISNTGTGALTINSEAAPAPFGVDATRTTCGATLAVNASCTVAVFFTPTTTGAATGTLTITDNAPVANSTQTVSLSGNGVAAAPALTASPTSATCPTVAAHSTSTCSTVTLTSTTAISSMTKTAAPAAEFAVSGTSSCGSTLAANTPCTLVVTFSPAEADVRDGTVTISYTTVSGTQVAVIPYSGTGT
jgi:hypothetical protein